MKHQYFGDISDYKKYSLLRIIVEQIPEKLLVCWMLTPDNGNGEGNNNKYLLNPNEWRSFDPEVFDFLYEKVMIKNHKNLTLIEASNLIPQTLYFNKVLEPEKSARELYFKELTEVSEDAELIFFDPDNGIEVSSIAKGKKGSEKYVYWEEVESFWKINKSILIYQHFPRVQRDSYINKLSEIITNKFPSAKVYSVKTKYMVYFLLLQPKHKDKFEKFPENVKSKWNEKLIIQLHNF